MTVVHVNSGGYLQLVEETCYRVPHSRFTNISVPSSTETVFILRAISVVSTTVKNKSLKTIRLYSYVSFMSSCMRLMKNTWSLLALILSLSKLFNAVSPGMLYEAVQAGSLVH